MFGIGGGELIFILFVVLMLFGADKVPEIARTMGKAMAQLKNATNDIKSEIQKGAEQNGIDNKFLNDITGGVTSEINKAKDNFIGNNSALKGITDTLTSEIDQTQKILNNQPTKTESHNATADAKDESIAAAELDKAVIEEENGPIKRKK